MSPRAAHGPALARGTASRPTPRLPPPAGSRARTLPSYDSSDECVTLPQPVTAPGAAPGRPPSPGRFGIRASRAYDGSGGASRPDPLVVVEDGWIVAFEDASRIGDPGCPVID